MNQAKLLADAAFWLFSATAQCFAALTALTGLFAVFRLQSINREKDDLRAIVPAVLSEVRERINAAVPQAGLRRIPYELQPIRGEVGWRSMERIYAAEYERNLALYVQNYGQEKAQWAREMNLCVEDSFVQYRSLVAQHRACRLWAVTATVADGLVALMALVAIPFVPSLRHLASVAIVILVMATVAIVLTLVASVWMIWRDSPASQMSPALDVSEDTLSDASRAPVE